MFTGLIEATGVVSALNRGPGLLTLSLSATLPTPLPIKDIKLGDSIAVDGCCLTVTAIRGDVLSFGVAEESLRRTSLGEWTVGQRVHLERAMRADSRFDGHIVQGHVDTIGRIHSKRPDGDALWVTFSVDPKFTRYMVEKGAIALDGVSLTLTEVTQDSCSVMLIPYSQQKTHFAQKPVGAAVNIEVDVLAKYVERLIAPRSSLIDKLKENGFS